MTYPIKYNKSLVSLEGMRRAKELIIKTPRLSVLSTITIVHRG